MGERAAVAIVGGRPEGDALLGSDPVHPCGRCRQILNEAAERSKTDILVHCASGDGSAIKSYRLSELLPAAFGPKALGLIPDRSEEHPSELQSLLRISYAVFCLTPKCQAKQHQSQLK